jgi:hypothetical protein
MAHLPSHAGAKQKMDHLSVLDVQCAWLTLLVWRWGRIAQGWEGGMWHD